MKASRVLLHGRRVGVLRPGHPHANSNGYVLEHRAVIEERLGRLLLKGEEVHHLNGDPTDNRFENLVLRDRRSHIAEHRKPSAGKPFGRPHTRLRGCDAVCGALRRLRVASAITQGELGRELAHSAAWICELERGFRPLSGEQEAAVRGAIGRILARRREQQG